MATTKRDHAEIYFEVHGDQGTPVVLCSGMGGSANYWTPQIPALASSHRVAVYDHVGTGRSSREVAGQQSIERMADDLLAVMDACNFESAHLVGHAIGGIVALSLALHAPARVKSLALVNAWARADDHLRRCFAVRKEILRASGPRAYVQAQPLFLYPPRWIAEHDRQLREEEQHLVDHFPSSDLLRDRIDMFLNFDALDRLPSVSSPTLVLAARDDALVPAYLSNALAAGIPNSTSTEIEWGGHAFTAIIPEVFNQTILDFLRRVDLQTASG